MLVHWFSKSPYQYRHGVVMELVTQSKAMWVPVFVCCKKLASVLIDVWHNGDVERQTHFNPKAHQSALDISPCPDVGQRKEVI